MRRGIVNAVWVWVLFYVLAVINGIVRELFYVPQLGDTWGRVAGTLVLVVAMLAVIYVYLRRAIDGLTRTRLVAIGVLWVSLSLFFELAFSHWVMEEPWELVRAHYNVMEGRFRVLLRAVELLGPVVIGLRLLGRREAAEMPYDEQAYDEEAPPEEAPAYDAPADETDAEGSPEAAGEVQRAET